MRFVLVLFLSLWGLMINAQSTGEYVDFTAGTPTWDHFFVRGTYDDLGSSQTYDNVVSFKSGDTQLVWIHLNDDEIYLNEDIQSLTPADYKPGYPYNEITYNSFWFDIYMPQSVEIFIDEDEETDEEILFVQGDRLPSTSTIQWAKKSDVKVIDGLNYDVYTFVCFNPNYAVGNHFSAKNRAMYEANGALKKDATLFGIYVRNKNQNQAETRIEGDMILGNIRLYLDETSEIFFYGTGGKGVENRYMKYNRVALYGSRGLENVFANSIYLNQTNAAVTVGNTLQLLATVMPEYTTNNIISWTSSNTSVATVSSDGLVTCHNTGTATITARTTDGTNLSASCFVTVREQFATAITLNKSYTSLYVGDNEQLTATIQPSSTANQVISWSSSDPNVATVNSYGKISAISAGTATITAMTTDGSNLSASCVVNVSNRLATSIALNKTNITMDAGTSEQLVATVYPSNASNKSVVWSSSNPNVATVSDNGLVTAILAGNATITATTSDGSNLSASCSVTVNNILATSISVTPTNVTLEIDEWKQLSAIISPSNATNQSVIWNSANTSIASVSTMGGKVHAISPGTVIITATTTDGSNLSTTCRVTVNERKATSIELNQSSLSLYVNETSQLSATVYPEDVGNKTVSWKSSNNAVATVNNNGLVTALASGTATITATTTDGSNLSASCNVSVSIIPVTSVSLNKTSLTLDIDENYQLAASVYPSNATYKTVTWKSSNNAVATVSSNGLIMPQSPGEATITATTTDGTNLTASCQVTIVKRVKSISLSESNLTLILPETTQLFAYLTPSDATNTSLNWTSTNTSVATVDNNGLVTSVAPGTATIKATTKDGTNLTATCMVTVKRQLVTSITLNESDLVMHIGDIEQLIASISPDNASNKSISWVSGNSAIATVDDNGLVTAVEGGTTYIRARANDGSGVYANCTITVIPDYYITLDTLSHIRGMAEEVVDFPVTLVNKNPISGIQFDVSLPNDVSFNLIDGEPDVWLDDARGTRSHSISASQLSNGVYRVLVTSSSSRDLRGNDGELVHMNLVLPQMHNTGNYTITISNIIASESNETRHTLWNKSALVCFYYLVGDADANGVVDIADHTATASKILGKSPSPFYYNAANVDGNGSLDVVDLVGITNIALEIRPTTVRQAPAIGSTASRLLCDRLRVSAGGEAEITIGMDCAFNFAGFQMDMTLPRGLTLADAYLGETASRLGLAIESLPDGRIRLLGTSFSDAEVSGLCNKLLTMRVKADRSYQEDSEIEFTDILFAERNLTGHYLDASCIEYVEPSSVYELMSEAHIYFENGNIIVDTPVAGTMQLIAVDGRMIEYQAQVGHNVYPVNATGIYIIHFNGKTLKIRF